MCETDWGVEWPDRHYRVILADPPWRFDTFSDNGRGRSADNHYPVMRRADLLGLPVDQLAHPEGAALFLWTTSDQHEFASSTLIRAWGFIPKSRGPEWVKCKQPDAIRREFENAVDSHRRGEIVDWPAAIERCLVVGMGYSLRQQTEECILATTKKIPPRMSRAVRQVVVAPRREHSRKPEAIYERIEELFEGPRLEMFSRNRRPGWDCWGNETGKFTDDRLPLET